MPSVPPISVIIPAHKRYDTVAKTLSVIASCQPGPQEILIHVDGGDMVLLDSLQANHPDIRVLKSVDLLGPGGSRNSLIDAASHEWVANFDEDSFPAHSDYFARLQALIARFPDAAMFSAASNTKETAEKEIQEIAIPSGCGCIFRKSWFARTGGFVPLPIAYGMEEVDMGLRIHAHGGSILLDPLLRVVHDKQLSEEVDSEINAGIIANTALFPYLRFPTLLWPLGLWGVLSRVVHLISRGWTKGLASGIQSIPTHLLKHQRFQSLIPLRKIVSWHFLRRFPQMVLPATQLTHKCGQIQ